MAIKHLLGRIIHKHDTEENWDKATGFIPQQGEIIVYDIDTTHEHERFKIGDGKTSVNNLPFQVDISDFEDYKVKQSKVVDPSANGSALTFIDSISQDEMGKIAVTKKYIGVTTDSPETKYAGFDNKGHLIAKEQIKPITMKTWTTADMV
jgi:hypothetical protein